MPVPPLNIYRHDRDNRTLITLAGEIDLTTAPLVSTTLAECLRDGVRTADVDLTAVTFCDASGLNAFLAAFWLATDAGMTLRLHYPPPIMARIIEITGAGFLLDELHAARPPSPQSPSPRVLTTMGGAP